MVEQGHRVDRIPSVIGTSNTMKNAKQKFMEFRWDFGPRSTARVSPKILGPDNKYLSGF